MSPDGRLIILRDNKKKIAIYDIEGQQTIASFPLDDTRQARFSPNRRYLTAGRRPEEKRVFDLREQ